jgi:putative hydrolase of the HAD superfamily
VCQELAASLVRLDNHGYARRETVFGQLKHDYASLPGTVEELINTYWQEVIEHVVLEPEIEILLQNLQAAQIPFGIITNGTSRQQRRKITRLGFTTITPCIFISGEFGVEKPDPSIFRAAAQCLGRIQPAEILFVGDHPRFDMWGAHMVGMKTIWVHHDPRTWPDDIAQDVVNATVHSFAELLAILGLTATTDPTTASSKHTHLTS